MVQKTLACFAVALCLMVGTREASATPPPPSYLAQLGINQIDNLACAFENWLDAVCPIYANVVCIYAEYYPETGLAEYYADLYAGIICSVADSYINSVNSTANVYLSLLTTSSDKNAVRAARNNARERIRCAKEECICYIYSQLGGPAPASMED